MVADALGSVARGAGVALTASFSGRLINIHAQLRSYLLTSQEAFSSNVRQRLKARLFSEECEVPDTV